MKIKPLSAELLKVSPNTKQTLLIKEEHEKFNKELKQASLQFEEIFLRQIIKGFRDTIPESDFMPKSHASNMYEEMLDDQYAQKMSQNGGLGLSHFMYEHLQRKD